MKPVGAKPACMAVRLPVYIVCPPFQFQAFPTSCMAQLMFDFKQSKQEVGEPGNEAS